MRKHIDRFLKIGLLIWAIFIILCFVLNIKSGELTINNEVFEITSFESFLLSFFFGIIFVLASFCCPPFNIIVIYLFYRAVVKNRIKANAKFEAENLEYCREHLNKLSPEIISYLNDFNIEFSKDFSAHILKLLYEGYILEDGNTFVVGNKDKTSLSSVDIFVLEAIRNKNYDSRMKREYEKLIEKEALENKFISFKNKEGQKLLLKIMIFLGVIIFAFSNIEILFSDQILKLFGKFSIFFYLGTVFVIFLPFIFVAYLIVNIMTFFNFKTNIIRTSKGNRIVKDALGLRKFLEDVGNFEEKSYKEVYTRGYFLIYAVVLGLNKNIINDVMKKIGNNL